MIKTLNIQDSFLNEARKRRAQLTVFLVNGFQMRGTVLGFDSFTVMLESDGRQQLIYKHAISTIAPVRSLNIPELDAEGQPEEERELVMR